MQRSSSRLPFPFPQMIMAKELEPEMTPKRLESRPNISVDKDNILNDNTPLVVPSLLFSFSKLVANGP